MTPIGPIGEEVSKVTTTVPTNHIRWNSGILEQKWETKFYFPERPSTFAWRPIDTVSEPKSLVCANKGIVKTLREEIDRLRAQLRPFLPTDGAVSKPVFSFEEQSSIHNWGKIVAVWRVDAFTQALKEETYAQDRRTNNDRND